MGVLVDTSKDIENDARDEGPGLSDIIHDDDE
jgi:hypothetical protein